MDLNSISDLCILFFSQLVIFFSYVLMITFSLPEIFFNYVVKCINILCHTEVLSQATYREIIAYMLF